MITTLGVLSGLLYVAWLLLVVSCCIAVYRAARLRSLPWIAAHYAIAAMVFVPTMYLLRHTNSPTVISLPQTGAFTPESCLSVALLCIESLSSLLLAILAFSEVAFLILRSFPETRSQLLELLLKAHQRIPLFGTALIVLTILRPIPFFIFQRLHPA